MASSIFAVVAATHPDPPVNLTRDQANTSKTQVAITWSAGPSNGGSVVIDYTIFWDQGINSYVQAASGITALAYTRSTGISTGTAYKFKVQARNAVGLSGDSSEFSVIAATVPGTPSAPTTSITGDEIYMTVDWTIPTNNGGVSVLGYRLEVLGSDLAWHKDLVNCDAATSQAIIDSTSCQIPTDVLRASPFTISQGTSLQARVIAFNAIGDSTVSAAGNGGTMPQPPTVPGVPENITRNNVITD